MPKETMENRPYARNDMDGEIMLAIPSENIAVCISSEIADQLIKDLKRAIAGERGYSLTELIDQFKKLDGYADTEDFVVFTYSPLTTIQELLKRMVNIDSEIMTRELLRRLRDSMMDGGWDALREQSLRLAIIACLEEASKAESVTSYDLTRWTNQIWGPHGPF